MFEAIDRVLNFFEIKHSEDGIRANLDKHIKNKEALTNLLRKHPDWNESVKAIITEEIEERTVADSVYIGDLMDNFYNLLSEKSAYKFEKMGIWREYNTPTMTKKLADYYNWQNVAYELGLQTVPVVGQKTTRFIRALLIELGADMECGEMKGVYTRFADALSPYTAKRNLIISVNPADFLTMSYGTTWTSCHIINPEKAKGGTNYSGCYKLGTLSYMNDESSLITYTVEKLPSDLSELPLTPRITRQMFMVNIDNQCLLQSRYYPYSQDSNLISIRRKSVQKVLAKCFGIENEWDVRAWYGDGFDTYCSATHYRDYEHDDDYEIATSYAKGKSWDSDVKDSIIGHTAYCLNCGEAVFDENSLLCGACQHEGEIFL